MAIKYTVAYKQEMQCTAEKKLFLYFKCLDHIGIWLACPKVKWAERPL